MTNLYQSIMNEMSDPTGPVKYVNTLIDDPEFIKYLRTCSTDPNVELAATFHGKSSRGIGVNPVILSENADGTKVYGFSGKQVTKVLKKYDEHIAEEEDRARIAFARLQEKLQRAQG